MTCSLSPRRNLKNAFSPANRAPAPLFDAGDGQIYNRSGWHQQGGVHDAVLFAAHELIAQGDQDQPLRLVDENEHRHAAVPLLLNAHGIARKCVHEESVGRPFLAPVEQRVDRHGAGFNWFSHVETIHKLRQGNFQLTLPAALQFVGEAAKVTPRPLTSDCARHVPTPWWECGGAAVSVSLEQA